MITKVLEYMTCFCGEKLQHKPVPSFDKYESEDTRTEDSNEEKETNLILIKLIIEKNFPKQRNSRPNKISLRLSSVIPKIEFKSLNTNVLYDSDTEVFKTSEGIFIFMLRSN